MAVLLVRSFVTKRGMITVVKSDGSYQLVGRLYIGNSHERKSSSGHEWNRKHGKAKVHVVLRDILLVSGIHFVLCLHCASKTVMVSSGLARQISSAFYSSFNHAIVDGYHIIILVPTYARRRWDLLLNTSACSVALVAITLSAGTLQCLLAPDMECPSNRTNVPVSPVPDPSQ